MPNNDLGTAHGKVRIKYDSVGQEKANAAMLQMEEHLKTLEQRAKKLDSQLGKLDSKLQATAGGFGSSGGSADEFNGQMASAAAGVGKMLVQLTKMNKSLESIDKRLSDSNKSLEQNQRELIDTTKAVNGYSNSVFNSHKRITQFRDDTKDLVRDLGQLNQMLIAGRVHWNNFSNVIRVLNTAGGIEAGKQGKVIKAMSIAMADFGAKTNRYMGIFADTQRNALAWTQKLSRGLLEVDGRLVGLRSGVTLLGGGFYTLWQKIKGVEEAIDRSPAWNRKLLGVANTLMKIGGGMALVSTAAWRLPNLFSRIVRSGALDKIQDQVNKLRNGFTKLEGPVLRIFGSRTTARLRIFNNSLKDTDMTLKKLLDRASAGSGKLSAAFQKGSEGLLGFAKSSSGLLTGIAFLVNGLASLKQRFEWFFRLPKSAMAFLAIFFSKILPTGLLGAGKSLKWLSNVIAGTWDGIKQLSRGLLVLPGLFASVGAVASSLFPVFNGLKDKFKDIFSDDPAEAAAAWLKLPAHLRPIADALVALKKPWKEFQESLQKTAFRGAEKQIEALGKVYLPLVEKGARNVVLALRDAKDQLVEFALSAQTQKDIAGVYDDVASALISLGRAVRPAAQGMQDLASVGVAALRDQAVWAEKLSQRFADWARINRNNGNLMDWIVESKQGVADLVRGLKEAAKGVYQILTLFQTNVQTNALQRFADEMERFNRGVAKSKVIGVLSRIRHTINTMGADKLENVKDLMNSFGNAIERMAPFFKQLTDTFTNFFTASMQTALYVTSGFLKVLNEIGATPFLGWLAAVSASMVLLPKWFAVGYDAIKALTGGIMILANRKKVLSGLETAALYLSTALDRLGPIGKKAGAGLANITTTSSGLISKLSAVASGAAIAVTAIAAIGLTIYEHKQNMKEFGKTLDNIAIQSQNFGRELSKAFIADKGKVGSNVLTALSQNTDSFLENLKTLEDQTPGIMDHIGDNLQDMVGIINPGNWVKNIENALTDGIPDADKWYLDSEEINRYQVLGDNAKRASKELSALAAEGIDLNSIIRSSDPIFTKYTDQLREQGKISDTTVDLLREQHDVYAQIQKDMVDLGPAGIQAADAFRQIAESAGDAEQELDGMRKMLVALGIIKLDAAEAAMEYIDAIEELPEKIRQAIEEGDGLTNVFDAQTGALNEESKTARNLLPIFKDLSNTFLQAAVSGDDVDGMVALLNASLDAMAGQLGVTRDLLDKFIDDQVGLGNKDAAIIKITAQLSGKEETEQQFARLLTNLMAMAQTGTFVPITFENKTATQVADIEKQLEAVVGDILYRSGENSTVLQLRTDITPPSQEQIDAISRLLRDKGWSMPGLPPPAEPPTLIPTIGGSAPGGQPPAPGGLTQQQKDLLFPSAAIQQQVQQPVQAPPLKTDILQQSMADTDQMLLTWAEGIGFKLDETNTAALNAGSKFVDAFAEGLEKNPKAFTTLDRMLEELKKRIHQSPPKKGPLAVHGDAARFGGSQFVRAYAGGIASESAGVANATEKMAGYAVSGVGVGQGVYETGEFLGELSRLNQFMAHFAEVVGKIGETILNFVKFVSDPLGKGTFFGKPLPYRRSNVSDEQLQRQREDRMQEAVSQGLESGTRNTSVFDARTAALGAAGNLGANPKQQEVANYIINRAMAEGYTREQANQFLTQAFGESGLSATASNPAGWRGVFQFDAPTWKLAGGGDVMNAQQNIDNYFRLARIRGLSPETFASGTQLGTQVSIGGPYHPENAAKGALANAVAGVQQYIAGYSAAATDLVESTTAAGAYLGATRLSDTGNLPSSPEIQAIYRMIEARWGSQITGTFSGSRPVGQSTPRTHDIGRSLDIPIGPNQKALGDEINAWLKANAKALGIEYTIWQQPQHYDHIDVHLAENATMSLNGITPQERRTGPPRVPGTPGYTPSQPNQPFRINPQTGQFEAVNVPIEQDRVPGLEVSSKQTPNGLEVYLNGQLVQTYQAGITTGGEIKGPNGEVVGVIQPNTERGGLPILTPPEELNPLTKQPWTQAEREQFMAENPMQYTFGLTPQETQDALQNQNITQQTLDQILTGIQDQNPLLKDAVSTLYDMQATDDQRSRAFDIVNAEAQRQGQMNTATSRYAAKGFENIVSDAASQFGFEQAPNPMDEAMNIVAGMTTIAGDIFNVIDSAIEAAGATKNIADTFVRGVANTEDVYKLVDEVQKFIKLGADIAGATSSILGVVGSLAGAGGAGAGGADMGGMQGAAMALQAASQVAAMIQAALETVNAVIDLGQEAYRIIGSYVGDFLGYLVGGPGGLQGDVKFLLDQTAGKLYAYGSENPLAKASHNAPGDLPRTTFQQTAGQINVYSGPGTDPRDDTRQMIFQIKAAQMAGATAQ